MEEIKRRSRHRITHIRDKKFWFLLSFLFFVMAIVLMFLFLFAIPRYVGLEVVLSGENLGMGVEPLILFSILTFTLAAISLAKGYEVFKREKDYHQGTLDTKLIQLNIRNHSVRSLNLDLIAQNENLKKEKEELFNHVKELEDKLCQTDENEKLLHKSIMVLKDDLGKLLSQKEKLMMDMDARNSELQRMQGKNKKIKKRSSPKLRKKIKERRRKEKEKWVR